MDCNNYRVSCCPANKNNVMRGGIDPKSGKRSRNYEELALSLTCFVHVPFPHLPLPFALVQSTMSKVLQPHQLHCCLSASSVFKNQCLLILSQPSTEALCYAPSGLIQPFDLDEYCHKQAPLLLWNHRYCSAPCYLSMKVLTAIFLVSGIQTA